ncbi:MAG: hypothetical protein IPF67_14650 [Saprospiraceae bacterium]|nr:hypothetical protein [Candidatus Brachybacter algidus]
MTHINTGINQPGIVELLFYKNSTGNALANLAHALLVDKSPLTSGERELIGAYVSYLNVSFVICLILQLQMHIWGTMEKLLAA